MLTLTLLSLSLSYLPGTQPSKLTLGVVDGCRADSECKGNRLCEEGLCVAGPEQAPTMVPKAQGVTSVHLRLINQQIQLLSFSKLSLVGPIIATAIASLALAASVPFFIITYLIVIAIPLASSGIVFLGIGLPWLFWNLNYNARIDRAIDQLREERVRYGQPSTPAMLEVGTF